MNETINAMRSPMEVLQMRPVASDDYGVDDHASDLVVHRRAVRIGASGLLFAEGHIGEVLDPSPSLHAVPNTTEWFSGVVNIRGNIVPVFNIALLLNQQVNSPKNSRLFVYGKGDAMAAFYMDDLPKKLSLDSKQLLSQSPLETTLDQYVQATYILGDVIWLDMDMEAMFSGLAGRMKST
ncbi:MAG: CheW domain-containing protein [Mariprofundaceae bacterium]|nr:CheW domain-containing protein [Mariprofundaceae bacterium]